MPTTTRRRPRRDVPAGLRGVGVLLVLLGLVAMHQMAGGNHLATMAAAPAATAAVSAAGATAPASGAMGSMPNPMLMHADGGGLHAQVRLPAQAAASAAAAAHPPAGHDAMPACLAVLAGLLLLAVPPVARVARLTPPYASRGTRRRTSPPGRGPPRSLLAQLCVLRT